MRSLEGRDDSAPMSGMPYSIADVVRLVSGHKSLGRIEVARRRGSEVHATPALVSARLRAGRRLTMPAVGGDFCRGELVHEAADRLGRDPTLARGRGKAKNARAYSPPICTVRTMQRYST